jgi:hypothetical protein
LPPICVDRRPKTPENAGPRRANDEEKVIYGPPGIGPQLRYSFLAARARHDIRTAALALARGPKGQSTVGKILAGVGPRFPQVVVLVGATGDLARRKLLPGLFHLATAGFMPGCRIIGVSLDELSVDGFREAAHCAIKEFFARKVGAEDWQAFATNLDYVALGAGADALRAAVERAEQSFDGESRRLHYLSVPPSAALSAVRMLGAAGLVERARIVMEKPFGTDLASAQSLNTKLHEVFNEEQIFRIDHFLGKEPAQNILAFRFANGLFEPIWNRNFIDHIQIDVPETLGLGQRVRFSAKRRTRSSAASCRSGRAMSSEVNTRATGKRTA